jgi:putative flippase GtrA
LTLFKYVVVSYPLVRYALTGIANTISGVGVMVGLAWLGFHYILYTAVGYIVAFITSYVLNGLFTFRVERLSHKAFLLFVALNGTLLLSVEGLQIVLIEYARVRELSGVFFGGVAYSLTGYFMNKRLVYRVS